MSRMIPDDYCVSTRPYGHWTIEYTLNSIKNCGFRNIEFWAGSPHYCYADYTPEERQARREYLKDLLDSYGLRMKVFSPEQIGSYPLNIASENELVREFCMQVMLDYVDDAAFFGAEIMRLDGGWQFIDQNKPENLERAVESIKIIAEKAKKAGIVLYMEAMGQSSGTFAYNRETLADLLGRVNADNVKGCVNIASLLSGGESVDEWFRALDNQIALVHFADAGGFVPGEKTNAVAGMLSAVDRQGYKGNKVLEITFRDCCLVADKVVFRSAEWLRNQNK